ncbi:hypothetical protein K1719_029554 [Acacia pycnantha]|nr:hypothetical protein K1719_029554 [Acacia pycnantha]
MNHLEKKLEENPAKLKQFVLQKLENMPSDVKAFLENTDLDHILSAPLRYRHPWELVFGNINKGNVCVAGDAFHPMTPDLGQVGCCALEDGVVLARCLGEFKLVSFSRDKFLSAFLAGILLKTTDFDYGKLRSS